MRQSADDMIDRFVSKINSGYREPLSPSIYKNPPSVLVGSADEYDNYDWAIKPYSHVDWVEPLEQRLGHRLPEMYRSLVTRYIFPEFEAGDIMFFANTPEGSDYYEFRERVFLDQQLYEVLSPAGFVQFGQPAGCNYDPICFDLNRWSDDDCPIMQIEHEAILCDGEIGDTRQVAASFRELIDAIITDA